MTRKKENNLLLHADILNILYEHRRFVAKIYRDIMGFYNISHIGLSIVNPAHELVVFSTTPNIEYNLISNQLWTQDCCFNPSIGQSNKFSWWGDNTSNLSDNQQNHLNKIKLLNNNFTLGMSIARNLQGFDLIYSFASKSKQPDLQAYYATNLPRLIEIGDFFYKSMRPLYLPYSPSFEPPDVRALLSLVHQKHYLRLVVDNESCHV